MNPRLILSLVACAIMLGCATSPENPAARNTIVIRRYFDEWANHANAATADELIAPDLVLINPPSVLRSLEDYKKGMAAFHAAFPDLQFTIEELIASGDKVVVRWTLRGTHEEEFQGHPATGRKIAITGTSTFRLEAGKIRQIWVNMDRLGMMDQLGWLK